MALLMTLVFAVIAFGVIYTIVMVILAIVVSAGSMKEAIENNKAPVITEPATIVKKKREILSSGGVDDDFIDIFVDMILCIIFRQYAVTYVTSYNVKVRQSVKSKDAKNVHVGTTGMLTHKGTNFISFQAN